MFRQSFKAPKCFRQLLKIKMEKWVLACDGDFGEKAWDSALAGNSCVIPTAHQEQPRGQWKWLCGLLICS